MRLSASKNVFAFRRQDHLKRCSIYVLITLREIGRISLMIAPAIIVVSITGAAMGAAFTWTVIIYLVALVVAQALSTAVGKRSKLQTLGRYLSVGTIPLLFVFLLRMILEVLEVLGAFH